MAAKDFIAIINGDFITALGSVSSIAGLVLSVFVLFAIGKIRKFYIFTARVPQDNEKLAEIASSISSHLNSFEGYSTKTYEILANAEITLKSLGRKVDGPLKKQVNKLIKDINLINKKRHPLIRRAFDIVMLENLQPDQTEKDFLEEIYLSLYKITKECSARYEDARWER
ncbi:MAG: hypothetical protein D3922_02885 [Candidatus Electrothrix sp. AR1]|nr:hypothetical protein [Candidatus Electrothrix sp. AR1]